MSSGSDRDLILRELGYEESEFIICYGIWEISFQKE